MGETRNRYGHSHWYPLLVGMTTISLDFGEILEIGDCFGAPVRIELVIERGQMTATDVDSRALAIGMGNIGCRLPCT